jgi:hypothetical protein
MRNPWQKWQDFHTGYSLAPREKGRKGGSSPEEGERSLPAPAETEIEAPVVVSPPAEMEVEAPADVPPKDQALWHTAQTVTSRVAVANERLDDLLHFAEASPSGPTFSEEMRGTLDRLQGIFRPAGPFFPAEKLLKRLFSRAVMDHLRRRVAERVIEGVRSMTGLPPGVAENERVDFLSLLYAVGEGGKYLLTHWEERDQIKVRQRLDRVMKYHFAYGRRHYRNDIAQETQS